MIDDQLFITTPFALPRPTPIASNHHLCTPQTSIMVLFDTKSKNDQATDPVVRSANDASPASEDAGLLAYQQLIRPSTQQPPSYVGPSGSLGARSPQENTAWVGESIGIDSRFLRSDSTTLVFRHIRSPLSGRQLTSVVRFGLPVVVV